MNPEYLILLSASEGLTLTLRQSQGYWHVQAQRVVERELSAFYRCAVGSGQSTSLADAISLARSNCYLDLDSYTVRCAPQPAATPSLDLLSILNLPPKPITTGQIRRS